VLRGYLKGFKRIFNPFVPTVMAYFTRILRNKLLFAVLNLLLASGNYWHLLEHAYRYKLSMNDKQCNLHNNELICIIYGHQMALLGI